MKLVISERINKSKIKPEWDTNYWLVYIFENKKRVYTRQWNKMFDIKILFESLKSYPIHEINIVHSIPPHIDVFGLCINML
jgi:hypothetical protein